MGLEDEYYDGALGLKLTDIPGKIKGSIQKKAEETLWKMFLAKLKRSLKL